MSSIDFEVELTDEEREIQTTVHRFAAEEMRPAGEKLDKLHDPQEVIDPSSLLWEIFDKYDQLGISDLQTAESDLTPVQRARLQGIILEELAWGDSGLALSLACRGMGRMYSMMSGQADLIERFAAPGNKEIGCWAITEPDHGSDTLAMGEPHFKDANIKPNCIARKDGDEYVIQGQKSSWVSNGPIATMATLFCTIDGDRGFEGGGVAVVPLDLAGVSKGKPLDKIGQRALPQGEIFFDEVRIPEAYMIADQDSYAGALNMQLTVANSFMGVTFAGVARAAFDLANQYASERIQGGKPINQHQSVKLRLFDMFRKVETASAFCRKVQIFNSASGQPQLHYAIASKTYCTRIAFEVASEAVQIYGGNGLSREYPVEKLMRDARASMIEDGCNEVLSIVGGAAL
jgi:alkylation response protein AidB-like acyl-CoA dehydrogenase|tara:strand:- start:1610 stop:2818 length:1209 start_codon:yes stop_codon:yes gene_type:complete